MQQTILTTLSNLNKNKETLLCETILPKQIVTALGKQGINTLDELSKLELGIDLIGIKNLSRKSINAIEHALHFYGLRTFKDIALFENEFESKRISKVSNNKKGTTTKSFLGQMKVSAKK